jgi:hypothetical protein
MLIPVDYHSLLYSLLSVSRLESPFFVMIPYFWFANTLLSIFTVGTTSCDRGFLCYRNWLHFRRPLSAPSPLGLQVPVHVAGM